METGLAVNQVLRPTWFDSKQIHERKHYKFSHEPGGDTTLIVKLPS